MELRPLQTGPYGVNTWIVPLTEKYCFVVDPAACVWCSDEKVIQQELARQNLEPVAIVLTHGHFDHIAGLSLIHQQWPDAPVLIHRGDSDYIGCGEHHNQNLSLHLLSMSNKAKYFEDMPAASAFLEDSHTLDEYINVQDAKDAASEWTVLHTPGHSLGSVCLYNKNKNLLISGDTVFYHSWGRTDLPGGSDLQMHESFWKLTMRRS